MSHETRTDPPTYPEVLDIHDGAFSESIWGSDGFKTIKVSGQSDVVADSYKDDLTIAAGSNVTITTNAAGDTVTIASTAYTAGNGLQLSGNEFSVTALAITSVHEAANQAAQLALTTQEGDVVVRADENKSYVRNAGTAGNMNDFTLLKTPTDLVLSVAGNTGAITANQIRDAVEAATDSNTFTDADHTKLNGIDTGAKDDQTSAEIKSLLAGDNITGSHIADDAIDSEHYTDGSIDHVHLSGDCVDGDNIANDSLDSEHYIDGSIDEQHIANDAVTYAKIQNVSATDRILGRDSSGAGVVEEITPANLRTMINVEDGADVTDATNVASAGAVMKTTVDALGDLLVASADDTVTRLARGTNDHVLTADSSTGTGLKWAAIPDSGEDNQNAFSNVAVSGQTTVAADSATDTLTLAGAGSVTITTNATSDTVTITGSSTDATKMPLAGGTFTGDVTINDSEEIRVGSDNDLIIVHDGSNGFIKETTGTLDIRAKNTSGGLVTISDSAGENLIKATAGSKVELTYDGTTKFETTSAGVKITGNNLVLNDSSAFFIDHPTTGQVINFRVSDSSSNDTTALTILSDGMNSHADNIKSAWGSSNDLQIYHASSDNNSYIHEAGSGHLVLKADDLYIQNAAGSQTNIKSSSGGAVELSHNGNKKFETTSAGATVTGTLTATLAANSIDSDHYVDGSIDNAHLADDAVGIAELSATGTASSSTYLRGDNTWQTISSGGLGNVVEDTSPQLGGDLDTNSFEISLDDSHAVKFGDGTDLKIYHASGENFIRGNASASPLYIDCCENLHIRHLDTDGSNSETMIKAVGDGSVELYHNNVLTFQTESDGASIIGPEGSSAFLTFKADEGDDNADLFDVGVSSGGVFSIQNKAGGSWDTNIECNGSGNVELYYDNAKKFETHSTGASWTGDLTTVDGGVIKLGTGNDLQIWHDSNNHSFMLNNTGDFYIRGNNTQKILIQAKALQNSVVSTGDGNVELYYSGTKKFETTSAGATVTGVLTATLADNSIDSDQYVDGSIDHAHLANDCIDGDNIQDDVINSEHYAAASIDNEHLADDAVDSDELAAGAVDIAHLSASGTASSSTYLRGDNSWSTVSSGLPSTDSTMSAKLTVNAAHDQVTINSTGAWGVLRMQTSGTNRGFLSAGSNGDFLVGNNSAGPAQIRVKQNAFQWTDDDSTWYDVLHKGRAGLVIQVVSTTKTDTFSEASVSCGDASANAMEASITPTFSSSKILVIVDGMVSFNSDSNRTCIVLRRAGTDIGIGDADGSRQRVTAGSAGDNDTAVVNHIGLNYLDSPSTTSSTTYGVGLSHGSGSDKTMYLNRGGSDANNCYRFRSASHITLMEITA